MLQQIEPTDEQLAFIKAIDDEESAAQFGRKLSTAQQLWCIEFVANGGKIVEAASKAGYASPLTSGHKNMVHKGCQELIRRLSVQNVNLMLPSLFARLYAIATDEKTSARAAVDAINTLIDRVVAPHPKGPSTAIQINNGAAGDGVGKGQAQIIISELWTAREEREARRQAAHRAAGDIVDRQTVRHMSDIDGRMSDKSDAALQLLEHIVEGDGVGGDKSKSYTPRPVVIPVSQSSPLDNSPLGGDIDEYGTRDTSDRGNIPAVYVEDRSLGDGLLGVDGGPDVDELWSDEGGREEGSGDLRGADAERSTEGGSASRSSQLRQSAMREPEAFEVGDSQGEYAGQGEPRSDEFGGWGEAPIGEADGGEGSVYSEQPSRVQGVGSRAGSGAHDDTRRSTREDLEARNLAKEKNDDRDYEKNDDDTAPAGGDSAIGPGRGEGAAEEGGGDAGGWVDTADVGGDRSEGEIFSGFHVADGEGLCADVSGDAGIADAGAGSSERTVVGRSVAEVGEVGSVGEVVWGPVGGTAIDDSGHTGGVSSTGGVEPADAGGAGPSTGSIDIFADD